MLTVSQRLFFGFLQASMRRFLSFQWFSTISSRIVAWFPLIIHWNPWKSMENHWKVIGHSRFPFVVTDFPSISNDFLHVKAPYFTLLNDGHLSDVEETAHLKTWLVQFDQIPHGWHLQSWLQGFSMGFTPLERSMVLPWFYHGFTMVLPWFYHAFTMVLPWFDPISWIHLLDIVPFGQMLRGRWLVNYSIGMIINHYFLWCKLLVDILCLMVMLILFCILYQSSHHLPPICVSYWLVFMRPNIYESTSSAGPFKVKAVPLQQKKHGLGKPKR